MLPSLLFQPYPYQQPKYNNISILGNHCYIKSQNINQPKIRSKLDMQIYLEQLAKSIFFHFNVQLFGKAQALIKRQTSILIFICVLKLFLQVAKIQRITKIYTFNLISINRTKRDLYLQLILFLLTERPNGHYQVI